MDNNFQQWWKMSFFWLTLIRFLRGSITNQGLHFAALKPDHKSSPVSLVSTFFDYSSIFYTRITKAIRKYINYFNLIAELRINSFILDKNCVLSSHAGSICDGELSVILKCRTHFFPFVYKSSNGLLIFCRLLVLSCVYISVVLLLL